MAKLVRDDACGKSERMAELMQVITEATNERCFGAGTGQKPSIGGQRVKGTKEAEALDEFTHPGIHGEHAFGFELAQRHVNRPLMRGGGAQAVERQIGALADAPAGVANQQKGIAAQIIAAAELPLQKLILLSRERTWQSLREARNVLAADQMGEFGKRFGPSQLLEDGTERDEPVDIGGGRERRGLRAEAGHPAQEVGLTAQLVQAVHLGVFGAEIAQEVASSPTVVTSGFGTECSAEGIDSAVEDRNQMMLKRRVARADHEEVTGRGRMCCATARAY